MPLCQYLTWINCRTKCYFCKKSPQLNQDNTDTAVLDEKNFEQLFKSHFNEIVFLAQRIVKDLDTAKEIAQEAFVNLWDKRNSIDLSKPVRSYLSASAHNRSLNYLRDHKKFDRNLLMHEKLFDAVEDISPDHEHETLSKLIDAAMEELPEKCREIFRLNRFEDLKYREISEKLGISVKTVEAQMSKALRHMRNRLASEITLLLILYLFSGNY